MWEGFRGNQWYSFDDVENTQLNIDNNISPKEKREQRNITTLLNAFWHYIKYHFNDSYRKETDKKTLEVIQSEQFITELKIFLIKLDEFEKNFLEDDLSPNLLELDKDRAIFIEEINNRISKFNEENSFGISLSYVKDYWEDGVLRMIAQYNEYIFLIDYTEFSGFQAKHPWSL